MQASMPNHPRPRRRPLRLPAYDYSQAGAYFITVCTQDRVMLFGEITDCDSRWRLPKQGGFETRPYNSQFVRCLAKEIVR